MIKITDDMRELVNRGLADGVPALLATVNEKGEPNVGPKGSILVFDDGTLAYWERSHRSAIANVGKNPAVMVFYRNPGAGPRVPPGGAWRFHGRAEIVTDPAKREAVRAKVVKIELDRDPENKGIAVLIHVDRITELSGKVLQSR
jgi:predicted pyridoxine 5'-phosphate oxidase superfamily flavin-nucleotide-binding protein